MTDKPKTRTTEEVASELADVLAEIDRLTTRAGDLKLILQAKLGAGTHKAGELEVVVKPGARSLDAALFERQFPADKRPELYTTETKLDVKKVRANFGPNQLVPYLKPPNATSVSLK